MNISRFIATKVAFSNRKSFTKWIIRIAISAVALSLAVMIVAFSMISGFKNEISNKIYGFWGHIHINDINISRSFETIPIAKNQDFLVDLDTLSKITFQYNPSFLGSKIRGRYLTKRADIDISSVYPVGNTPAIISTKEEFEGVIVRGLGETFPWTQMDKYIILGRAIQYPEEGSSAEILVSSHLMRRLKLNLEDNVILNLIINGQQISRRTKIVGIYNTGLEEYDKKFIIADLKKVQELQQWTENQVAGFEVVLTDLKHLNDVRDHVNYEILPQQLYAQTTRDKFPNIFEWLELQDLNAVVILVLMIVVALINMITGILILIIERSKMIGTLMSLGMSNWDIRKIFLHYAAYIILYGLMIGNVIGLGVCYLQKYTGFIKLDEANYYLSVAPVDINLMNVMVLNLVSFFIILAFLTVPTYIIAKLSPVKILRFQ